MPDLPWVPQNPHPLYGTARGVASGVTLTAVNRRSNETQTVQTEAGGVYLVDCANFANGYQDGDMIELRVSGHRQITSVNTGGFPAGRQVDIVPHRYGRHRRR